MDQGVEIRGSSRRGVTLGRTGRSGVGLGIAQESAPIRTRGLAAAVHRVLERLHPLLQMGELVQDLIDRIVVDGRSGVPRRLFG